MFRGDKRFAWALELLERRDFDAADTAFCELLEREFTPVERAFLLNKRGVARIALERRELARCDFVAALEVRPDYAPALTNLGNLLLEEGDLSGAVARYEEAVRSDPEYAVAHLNLGVAYKKSGRVADAVRSLRLAQRLELRQRFSTAARSWPWARRR